MDGSYEEALGLAIRVARTERGTDRKQLAERTGLSYAYLSEMERGRKRASTRALRLIAEALDMPAHELVRYAEGRTALSPEPLAYRTQESRSLPTPAPASWFSTDD